MDFFTSDFHFGHDREFIYAARGYADVAAMDTALVRKWNSRVTAADDGYILGDLMLNDDENGLRLLSQLHGRLHIVTGNHDTDARIAKYAALPNVAEIQAALRYRYKGQPFCLSHYPMLTGNGETCSLRQVTVNLYGHTHQTEDFFEGLPWMYHVGVDSHDGLPVSIAEILDACKARFTQWKETHGPAADLRQERR